MNFELNSTQTSIKKFNKEKNGSNNEFHKTIGHYLWFYQQHNKTLREALNTELVKLMGTKQYFFIRVIVI